MKSWQTTAVGLLSAVIIFLTQAIAFLDGDPETVVSPEALVAALGVAGIGWFARDNNKTSEKAGAT